MIPKQSRPGLDPQRARITGRGAGSSAARQRPRFTVRGIVRVDLRADDPLPCEDPTLSRRVQFLACSPAGADVVLHVAAGQHVPSLAAAYLRAEGGHLGSVTVESSDPQTVRQWVDALRGHEPRPW